MSDELNPLTCDAPQHSDFPSGVVEVALLFQSGLRLTESDLPELPAGAEVDVMSFPAELLSFGDVVYGVQNEQPFVGHFLRHRGEQLELSQGGRRILKRGTSTVGRVIRARVAGRDFDPRRQNPLRYVLNRVTRFGTLFGPPARAL